MRCAGKVEEVQSDAAMIGDEEELSKSDAKRAGVGDTPASREQDTMTRLDTIDGLRGLGSLLVVAYHLRFGVRSAWVCIGLFFALSGFLMTSKVLQIQAVKGEFSILQFWRSRTLRLIPALLALVLCILAKTHVEWSIYGEPKGVEIHYLRQDLLWAVIYGENWNLVDRGEEYFADIDNSKASVVRHIWSLSIEEQYYILWPVIFAVIARATTCLMRAGSAENERGSEERSVMSSMLKPQVRSIVKVLCFFEVVAIIFSQYIGGYIYTTRGETAAYFSTYSRAGEFAVGGLAACLLHLSPWSLALFTRDPDRPPMTKKQRVGLEFASAVTVLSILGCSIIPLPSSDLLSNYFGWFRLPFTMLALSGGSLSTLQTSEPLPPWAIFTKLTNSRLLVHFGTTSYGLYLIHWVLISWFGDSEMNTIHSTSTPQGREEGAAAWGRDLSIAAASIAISSASFCLFERPVMVRARHLKPVKVIAISFASMAAVASLVMYVTKDAKDPGAVVPVQDQLQKIPIQQNVPVKLLFLGDSQAQQIADKMRAMSDNASSDPACGDLYGDEPWGPRIINGGKQGYPALQQFGDEECTWCKLHVTRERRVGSHARTSVTTSDAPYIVVMETHFMSPWHDHQKMMAGMWGMEPHLKTALYRFIQFSAWHGAQHIFLCTGSPYSRAGTGADMEAPIHWKRHRHGPRTHQAPEDTMAGPTRQREAWLQMLESFRCTGDDDPGQRVLVSVLDYHKLACPDFDEERAELEGIHYRCNETGPNFGKKIKEDLIHPTEEAGGYFLVRQLQRVLSYGIGRQGSFYSEPFRTPSKCYDRLYEPEEVNLQGLEPQKLLTTFEVCVQRDGKDRSQYELELKHDKVPVDLSIGQDIYMCKFFELPKLKTGVGVTGVKVLLEANVSHKYVHHVSYFDCDVGFEPQQGVGSSFSCEHEPFMNGCSRMIHTFNGLRRQSHQFRLPEGYMYPIESKYALLQVHYKAVAKESIVDSTGVSLNFGRFLKTVQYFELGPRSGYMLTIPAKAERHAVQSVCSANELAAIMDQFALNEFKVIASQHHMHMAGIAAMSEVIHPNGTTTPFMVEQPYDMHKQDMKMLPQAVVVSRGDAVKVTCVYSTKDRAKKTTLGVSLTDEMCFNYMLTTPRFPLFNACWHMKPTSVGDTSSFSLDMLSGLLAGAADSKERGRCYSSANGKSFTVPAKTGVQGPEAYHAKADVFQGLPEVCQEQGRQAGRRLRGQ
jgi:peptidoglycan/LPS O-acetylase OafA/YrhL